MPSFISKHDTHFRKCISAAERPALTLQFFVTRDAQQFFYIYICIYRFVWNPVFSATLLHAFLLTSCSLYNILFICSINISSFCQTFFLMFSIFSTKPKSEFSSRKVFFMFCFCITLLLGVLSCYARYDFDGFFSCQNLLRVNSIWHIKTF